MINLNNRQKEILAKYKINYENKEILNDLLEEIDDVMVSYVDKDDEPLPEFLELEKIYDEIYDQNE